MMSILLSLLPSSLCFPPVSLPSSIETPRMRTFSYITTMPPLSYNVNSIISSIMLSLCNFYLSIKNLRPNFCITFNYVILVLFNLEHFLGLLFDFNDIDFFFKNTDILSCKMSFILKFKNNFFMIRIKLGP